MAALEAENARLRELVRLQLPGKLPAGQSVEAQAQRRHRPTPPPCGKCTHRTASVPARLSTHAAAAAAINAHIPAHPHIACSWQSRRGRGPLRRAICASTAAMRCPRCGHLPGSCGAWQWNAAAFESHAASMPLLLAHAVAAAQSLTHGAPYRRRSKHNIPPPLRGLPGPTCPSLQLRHSEGHGALLLPLGARCAVPAPRPHRPEVCLTGPRRPGMLCLLADAGTLLHLDEWHSTLGSSCSCRLQPAGAAIACLRPSHMGRAFLCTACAAVAP